MNGIYVYNHLACNVEFGVCFIAYSVYILISKIAFVQMPGCGCTKEASCEGGDGAVEEKPCGSIKNSNNCKNREDYSRGGYRG